MKILVLTDHAGHSAENALYPMVRAMLANPRCSEVHLLSRSITQNKPFFSDGNSLANVYVSRATEHFDFTPNGHHFKRNLRTVKEHEDFDGVWLRLPPPIDSLSITKLEMLFGELPTVNSVNGILLTSSKAFLTKFPGITPRTAICERMADIEAMLMKGPLVLKPLNDYGGRGLIRIDENKQVWEGRAKKDWAWLQAKFETGKHEYLGMEYLKNVGQGDKRIVVVSGQIMGAALRLPAEGSWICNVAAGGTSNPATVDDAEREIVATVDPVLSKLGVVMYGVDTLVGNDGRRVLSELNTTSIGGLPQIAKMNNEPLVERAVDLILTAFAEGSGKL